MGDSPWGYKESDMTERLSLTDMSACPLNFQECAAPWRYRRHSMIEVEETLEQWFLTCCGSQTPSGIEQKLWTLLQRADVYPLLF